MAMRPERQRELDKLIVELDAEGASDSDIRTVMDDFVRQHDTATPSRGAEGSFGDIKDTQFDAATKKNPYMPRLQAASDRGDGYFSRGIASVGDVANLALKAPVAGALRGAEKLGAMYGGGETEGSYGETLGAVQRGEDETGSRTSGRAFAQNILTDPTTYVGGAIGGSAKLVSKIPALAKVGKVANYLDNAKGIRAGTAKALDQGVSAATVNQIDSYGKEGKVDLGEAGMETAISGGIGGGLSTGFKIAKGVVGLASKSGVKLPAWFAGIKDEATFREVLNDPAKLKEYQRIAKISDEELAGIIGGAKEKLGKVVTKQDEIIDAYSQQGKDRLVDIREGTRDAKVALNMRSAEDATKIKSQFDAEAAFREELAKGNIAKQQARGISPDKVQGNDVLAKNVGEQFGRARSEALEGYAPIQELRNVERVPDVTGRMHMAPKATGAPAEYAGMGVKDKGMSILQKAGAKEGELPDGAGTDLVYDYGMGMTEPEFNHIKKVLNKGFPDATDAEKYWNVRSSLLDAGARNADNTPIFTKGSKGQNVMNEIRMMADDELVKGLDENAQNAYKASRSKLFSLGKIEDKVTDPKSGEAAYKGILDLGRDEIKAIKASPNGEAIAKGIKEVFYNDLLERSAGDYGKMAELMHKGKYQGVVEELFPKGRAVRLAAQAKKIEETIEGIKNALERESKLSSVLKDVSLKASAKQGRREVRELSVKGAKDVRNMARNNAEKLTALKSDPKLVFAKAFLGLSEDQFKGARVGALKSDAGRLINQLDQYANNFGYMGPSINKIVEGGQKAADLGIDQSGKFALKGGNSRGQLTARLASSGALVLGGVGMGSGADMSSTAGVALGTAGLLAALTHPGLAYKYAKSVGRHGERLGNWMLDKAENSKGFEQGRRAVRRGLSVMGQEAYGD